MVNFQIANPPLWKFCRALCWINRGNLLLPRPGFPLYQVLCQGLSSWSCQWTPCTVHQLVQRNTKEQGRLFETHWSLELGYLLLGRRRDLHNALLQSHALWQAARTLPRGSGNCARIIKPRKAADAAGDYHGVEVRYYDLLPDKGWQCNIGDIAKLVDPASAILSLSLFDSARHHGPEPGHIEYQYHWIVMLSWWTVASPWGCCNFFPRAFERRVLLIVEVWHHIFSSSSSHLNIFTFSHLNIFSSSHLHIFSS